MDELRKIIRKEVYNLFESDDKYFNGMLILTDVVRGDSAEWEPLYNFLKEIFQEKYKKAADGYMFYGSYRIENFDNLEVYQYRHGITRKYFYVDKNGQPYLIDFQMDNLTKDISVENVKKISFQEQFKIIYSDLIKAVEKACEENDCEIPEDAYLMKYSDYQVLRDKMLEKHGYNVNTVSSKEDIEKFGKELEEEWSNKYKRSIDCSNPKGFSQKAHCAARKKRQRGENTKSKTPFK